MRRYSRRSSQAAELLGSDFVEQRPSVLPLSEESAYPAENSHPERISSVFDNDIGYPGMYDVFDDYDDTAAHDFLCPECKQHIISEYKEKKHLS